MTQTNKKKYGNRVNNQEIGPPAAFVDKQDNSLAAPARFPVFFSTSLSIFVSHSIREPYNQTFVGENLFLN